MQGCSCLSSVATYLPGTVQQGCSCLSGVETYLPGLCCRGAAFLVVSKPICRHCVAEVQLFKRCRSLSAGTVLQRCSCLSGVATYLPGTVLQGCSCLSCAATYLPALCCRDAAFLVVSKPICRHCVAEVQLFKWCQNISAGTVLQRCSCLRGCRNLSAGTVLQRCSYLSGVKTYLPALCSRGAAVKVLSNLSAGTVLQRCSCLSSVAT